RSATLWQDLVGRQHTSDASRTGFQTSLAHVHRRLAQLYATRQQWPKADAEYLAVLNGSPNDVDVRSEYAGVLLLLDRGDAYQQVCRRVLERFGSSKDSGEMSVVARLPALGPGSGIEGAEVVQRAEAAVAANPASGSIRHTAALANYRAGRFE